MSSIESISQLQDQDALVKLYILDLSPFDGPILRFTDARNGEVTFGGSVYSPTDIDLSGLEVNATDSTSYPSVKIAHIGTPAAAYLDTYDDFIGARFYRLRTYARFLDTGISPDPAQMFSPDKFFVERLTHLDGVMAEFELRSILNVSGKFLPRRMVLSSFCDFVYRRPYLDEESGIVEFVQGNCPWSGESGNGTYYDKVGADQVLTLKASVPAGSMTYEVSFDVEQVVADGFGLHAVRCMSMNSSYVQISTLTTTYGSPMNQSNRVRQKIRFSATPESGEVSWSDPSNAVWLRFSLVLNAGGGVLSRVKVRDIQIRDVTTSSVIVKNGLFTDVSLFSDTFLAGVDAVLPDVAGGSIASSNDTGPYYTESGDLTEDPLLDKCSKLLGNGCKVRFGENSVLPYRAFPGIRKVR